MISNDLRKYLTEDILKQIDEHNYQYVYDSIYNHAAKKELTELLITEAKINPLTYMRFAVPAYYACNSQVLDEVFIPSHISFIDAGAFAESSVTSVHIADGVKTIGSAAFYRCPRLREVVMADSVTMISPNAFDGCHELEVVYLSNSINFLHDGAFNNCDNITIIYNGTRTEWDNIRNKVLAFVQTFPTVKCTDQTFEMKQHETSKEVI